MKIKDTDVLMLIERTYEEKQTLGDVLCFDKDSKGIVFRCKSLELPWLDNQKWISCIPEGIYNVVKHISPTFGLCFWIKDVEGRSEILIHLGNYAGSLNPRTGKPDILGCVLMGEKYLDIDGDGIKDITNSRNTMKKLLEVMPNKFKIQLSKK